MDRIIIFGTGSVADSLFSKLDLTKVVVVAFVNSKKKFESFHEIEVITEKEICQFDYDYLVIASGYVNQIAELLKNYSIPQNKIVSYIYDEVETYRWISSEIAKIVDLKYNRSIIDRWINSETKIAKIYPSVFWDSSNSIDSLEKDFVREQTTKLIAKTIYDNNVEGEVAELGVYKGDFTVIIDRLFKEKKMYLFDTFEGFAIQDVEIDSEIENKVGESEKFKDTSVDIVLDRIIDKDRAIIKKGYFPETFDLEDEKFCFVSIDLNLESPVLDALELFYPRLSNGGYILVSDYYAPFYKGTKKAVDTFVSKWNVHFTPVADFYGSVLFCK
ncbi:TylF/MycF family methyltransferase [Butyrivibrio fibrisolvens]|uniref:TylF/MycF/NovP-related O-methyltransferase n=1 Tax=Pseudobutyrivibrio ruminis TaxID=46206 RepID=UPI0003FB8335|nr:TylF/MycF/NovP-related O-methyltransferase [Pseudobutyrivibrio ruminis]MDC7278808.1 TylF/MycF family methyltransferase [Butyrivibrio fibrisolvens]